MAIVWGLVRGLPPNNHPSHGWQENSTVLKLMVRTGDPPFQATPSWFVNPMMYSYIHHTPKHFHQVVCVNLAIVSGPHLIERGYYSLDLINRFGDPGIWMGFDHPIHRDLTIHKLWMEIGVSLWPGQEKGFAELVAGCGWTVPKGKKTIRHIFLGQKWWPGLLHGLDGW